VATQMQKIETANPILQVKHWWNSWVNPWQLKRMGVLGMNCRNHDFISAYNPRHLFPLVDDKLKTKLLAQEYEVATPALFFASTHNTTSLI
jgi:hypothetical protein